MLFNAWHEQDTRALVRRDRNHPSIIMWSIGNEIDEQSQGGNSNVAKELAAIVHSEDMTRPVTAACNGGNSARNGFAALLDTMGFNYQPDEYIPFHREFPNQPFFATETSSTISSRGEYFFPVTAASASSINPATAAAAAARRPAPRRHWPPPRPRLPQPGRCHPPDELLRPLLPWLGLQPRPRILRPGPQPGLHG